MCVQQLAQQLTEHGVVLQGAHRGMAPQQVEGAGIGVWVGVEGWGGVIHKIIIHTSVLSARLVLQQAHNQPIDTWHTCSKSHTPSSRVGLTPQCACSIGKKAGGAHVPCSPVICEQCSHRFKSYTWPAATPAASAGCVVDSRQELQVQQPAGQALGQLQVGRATSGHTCTHTAAPLLLRSNSFRI
jgi:hypothetical protein